MPKTTDKYAVDPSLARAWTLPASLYIDPTALDDEKERIFARSWQVMGRSAPVTNAGDPFTAELIDE